VTRVAPPSSVLGRLLEAAGYHVEVRPEATVALRPRDHRAVVIIGSNRSPASLESFFPTDAVHRTLVYDDDPGEVARSLAAERGMEVLDPSTLGPALGEILLPPPPEPTGEDGREPFPALERPLAIAPEGRRTVRPRIGRAEAVTLAGVDAMRCYLKLLPFRVAAYRVRPVSAHGGSGTVVRQLVAVNAVNRRAEIWDDGDRELVPSLEEPSTELAPQLTEAQAVPVALEEIRSRHTVHVDHTEQHAGALVIETRRVPPASDDIRLGPFSLLLVPYWYIEGSEGRVVLDAVTGRRVSGATD
jgi:hypothetical protein